MTPRIYIAIPVHNRLAIAAQCVPTVRAGMDRENDFLTLWDDGSTEVNDEARRTLEANTDFTFISHQIGIDRQRRRHFFNFFERMDRMDWTHWYGTDADAPHDPSWRSELLRLQEKYGGAPICGYNTAAHSNMLGNTIEDDPASEVIWRRFAPGVSYLLTRAHVEVVLSYLRQLPDGDWNWDWGVPQFLGGRFAVTRTSLVSHIGHGGYHHPEAAGWEGGDLPTSPTPWLVAKRAEVVAELKALCPSNPPN